MKQQPHYDGTEDRKRAILILKAVIDAGGMAGKREIWNRVNRRNHTLTLMQVHRMLRIMGERRHLIPEGRDPVMWVATQTGRDWVKRQK